MTPTNKIQSLQLARSWTLRLLCCEQKDMASRKESSRGAHCYTEYPLFSHLIWMKAAGRSCPPSWQKAMELSVSLGLSPLPCTQLGAPFKGESFCPVLHMGKWRWQQKFKLGRALNGQYPSMLLPGPRSPQRAWMWWNREKVSASGALGLARGDALSCSLSLLFYP